MEFLAALREYIHLSPRQGWVLLVLGLSGLLLVRTDTFGLRDLEAPYVMGLAVTSLLGFSILLVAAGFGIFDRVKSNLMSRLTREAAASDRARRDLEALETARVLNGFEALELIGILRRGEQRFVQTTDTHSLYYKGIISPVDNQSDTYFVTDRVWGERESLMSILAKRVVEERRIRGL